MTTFIFFLNSKIVSPPPSGPYGGTLAPPRGPEMPSYPGGYGAATFGPPRGPPISSGPPPASTGYNQTPPPMMAPPR